MNKNAPGFRQFVDKRCRCTMKEILIAFDILLVPNEHYIYIKTLYIYRNKPEIELKMLSTGIVRTPEYRYEVRNDYRSLKLDQMNKN